MKANRKILRRDDKAVSPVIAVILMVAITVVLAATVYVWVSGFGASGGQAKTLALSVTSTTGGIATLTAVSTGSPALEYSKLKITVDGDAAYGIVANGVYVRDTAWTSTTATSRIAPGDVIKVAHRTSGNSITVNFVDTSANTVVSQLVVPVSADTTVPTATATKADPSVVTLSEVSYTTSTFTAPNTLFVFTEVSGDADSLGATALSYSQGFSTINVDMAGATPAPDNTDTLAPHATNKIYDLAGNAWAATYPYS